MVLNGSESFRSAEPFRTISEIYYGQNKFIMVKIIGI